MAGVVPQQADIHRIPRLLFLPPVDADYSDDEEQRIRFDHRSTAEDEERLPPQAVVNPDQFFWYRWVLGHQVTFMFWRVLGDLLRSEDATAVDPMARCVDAYSAMLLYSATVPRHIYHRCIRPRMVQHHPAFSGTWAADFRPITQLLRGRSPILDQPGNNELAAAVHRNKVLHDHIAEHLVPGGRSLLRDAAGRGLPAAVDDKFDLYDNFFLTVRRPVTRDAFAIQLLSRIDEVDRDLRLHGVYPDVSGSRYPVLEAEESARLAHCVGDIPDVLRGAAFPAVCVLEGRTQ